MSNKKVIIKRVVLTVIIMFFGATVCLITYDRATIKNTYSISERNLEIPIFVYHNIVKDKSEIEYLKEVFKLSDGEAQFLITCSRGEGLIKIGYTSAVIAIKPTQREFEFVETNLNKIIEKRKMGEGE